MSERERCASCGAQLVPGNAFCTSCGVSLTSGPARSGGVVGPRPTPPRRNPGLLDAGPLLELVGRARRAFANLPLGAKALAVLAVVLLLLVLSRIVAIAATIVLGASALVLSVRAVRREPFGKWGVVAAASLAVALAAGGVSGAQNSGNTGGAGAGGQVGSSPPGGPVSTFDAPADMRLCLGNGGPEGYSGPALDFRIVDSDDSEAPSGARVLTLVVGTSLHEDLNAVAENLTVNPDAYDAAQVTVYPREWAFYDPVEGIVPLPGAPESVYTTYLVAHSPVGEEAVGLPDGNLNQCGTSYEDGGYKWGARETTRAGRASPSASPQPEY